MSLNIDKHLASIQTASAETRTRMRTNAAQWQESGTDAQKEAALRLLAALDQAEHSEREALTAKVLELDLGERVVVAFRAQPLTETEAKLVQVLLDNPGTTSTELTQAMGWEGQTWHMKFGTMCAEREVYLIPAEPVPARNGKFFSGILAELDSPGNTFTMKQEAASGFAQLGLRKRG